jgi:exportin-2 (importin alpha re-exporter)
METPKLTRPVDRKIAVIALTKALSDAEAFVSRYPKGWSLTCNTLLQLLVDPPVLTSAQADDTGAQLAIADPDDASFGVGFTQLSTCKRPLVDPYPEAKGDLRKWVGAYLNEADGRTGGRIASLVGQRLSPEQQTGLQAVMS